MKPAEINLHAPGNGRTTAHESLAGAWGIPELMPPVGGGTFIVKRGEVKYEIN